MRGDYSVNLCLSYFTKCCLIDLMASPFGQHLVNIRSIARCFDISLVHVFLMTTGGVLNEDWNYHCQPKLSENIGSIWELWRLIPPLNQPIIHKPEQKASHHGSFARGIQLPALVNNAEDGSIFWYNNHTDKGYHNATFTGIHLPALPSKYHKPVEVITCLFFSHKIYCADGNYSHTLDGLSSIKLKHIRS